MDYMTVVIFLVLQKRSHHNIISVQCVNMKSDLNNNNESDMITNRNNYVNLKSDTHVDDTDHDDTIVLPSVKKIATLFQDDKSKHPIKSNICPTKRSLEAG